MTYDDAFKVQQAMGNDRRFSGWQWEMQCFDRTNDVWGIRIGTRDGKPDDTKSEAIVEISLKALKRAIDPAAEIKFEVQKQAPDMRSGR